MTKYLKNGQEVSIIKEIEGGFLYHLMYSDYSEFNDEYMIDEEVTYFTEKVYDKPPTLKLSEDILKLQQQIDNLYKELNRIELLKNKEKGLLADIKQRDFVQGLVDYLNGDFKYILRLPSMEIIQKDKMYHSQYIKITNTKNEGFSLYTLTNENYSSYDDRPIMVFKTFEDAKTYAKKKLIYNLKQGTEGERYNWSSDTINTWFKGIHGSSGLKNDTDIVNIYTDKYNEKLNLEDKDRKERVLREIEKQQDILNKIKERQEQ